MVLRVGHVLVEPQRVSGLEREAPVVDEQDELETLISPVRAPHGKLKGYRGAATPSAEHARKPSVPLSETPWSLLPCCSI